MEVQYLQDVSKVLFRRRPNPAATRRHGLMWPAADEEGGFPSVYGFPILMI